MVPLMAKYIGSKKFIKYVADWSVVFGLLLWTVLIGETAKPFLRKFHLNDPRIQYPFTEHERVSIKLCGLLVFIVPLTCFVLNFIYNRIKIMKNSSGIRKTEALLMEQLHLLHISILATAFSSCLEFFLVDVIKLWVGRPRPDFLARCVPNLSKVSKNKLSGMLVSDLYDASICTAPMGQAALYEGLKSFPSGHSGIAFAGFGFLSIWLCGQLNAFGRKTSVVRLVVGLLPLTLALYIAISRSMDYRHHTEDIVIGSLMGTVALVISYGKYFSDVFDEDKCHTLREQDETDGSAGRASTGEPLLPI